jgi:hypothetical protein
LGKWAAELSQHYIELKNINKISSLGRFYGRLDSILKSKRRQKVTRLDNILQWSMGLRRGWCSSNNHIILRGQNEIHYKT